MTENHIKPLASQLAHRIFSVYLICTIGLIVTLAACQILIEFAHHGSLDTATSAPGQMVILERIRLSILFLLIAGVISAVNLWFLIDFFSNQLLTCPLQRFIEQIKSLTGSIADDRPARIDIGLEPSQELIHLRDALSELMSAASRQRHAAQIEATEAVKRAKSRFLATASHDLRQPMHAFNLYLGSLAELDVPKPVQIAVDNLNKCAKAMNDMLDTLLDITNIDAGVTKVRTSVFPIASPIDRIQAEFELLARKKNLTLRIARCSALVSSDEEIVERLLRLLVSNAIRYTKPGGKVLIGCRRVREQLRVEVVDNGLGIEKEMQQAIFEEHVQLNNDERNRSKGLGLGLTVAQRLAKLLKTSIQIDSTLGKGSLFWFDLPSVQLDTIQPITPDSSLLNLPVLDDKKIEDITIVVIDDEPLILDATQSLLECWGYSTITAANGQEAVKKLSSCARAPDMIICDYLLEGGEKGVTIISTLRSLFKQEIPAFLVTGITSHEHIETIRASGLAFMYKPLDRLKLKAVLPQFSS